MNTGVPRPVAPAPPWPAMLLTAGLGMRLRPLTRLCAKPALPVAGQPLVGRILRWLASAGIAEATLNLHHHPASITAAVGDGTQYGLCVRYSWEPALLGSAGGPARACPIIGAPRFFLVNGDTLTDVDLAALAAAHAASGALVTLAVIPSPDPAHYGGVAIDGAGCVTGFTAPGPQNAGLHFIGAQAVESEVFASLATTGPRQTIGDVYDALIARRPGSVRAFASRASFCDIGTAADYLRTSLELGRAAGHGDVMVENGAAVHESASLSRSIVWAGSRVASDVALDECVVAGGADVPAGSRFNRAVIRPMAGADDRDPFEQALGPLLVSPLDVRRPRP